MTSLNDFLTNPKYSMMSSDDYHSYQDYKKVVVKHMELYAKYQNENLNIVTKEDLFECMRIEDKADERLSVIFPQELTDKQGTRTVHDSLLNYDNYVVCEVDKQLIETLNNSDIPTEVCIYSFVSPNMVFLFPKKNPMNLFSLTIKHSQNSLWVNIYDYDKNGFNNKPSSMSVSAVRAKLNEKLKPAFLTKQQTDSTSFLLKFLLWQQEFAASDIISEPTCTTVGKKQKQVVNVRKIG